jgi:L1 cell adhesion molecule like protein
LTLLFVFVQVEIIANNMGNRTTPSYVSFVDSEVGHLTGEEAKRKACVNAGNTVFDAKRLIGCRFSDESVQMDMRHWPFKVIQGTIKISNIGFRIYLHSRVNV